MTSLQTEKKRSALKSFFDKGSVGPRECFRNVEILSNQLKLDWTERAIPEAAGCERDLDLARLYFQDVFDPRLRAEAVGSLRRAAQAFAAHTAARIAL